jgi:four helix bundle protein
MRRVAVFVSANIAEGSSRSSGKDFSSFIEIAYGSLMENVSEAAIARDQGFFSLEQHAQIYSATEKLARIRTGLRAFLLRPGPSTLNTHSSASA